MAEQKKTALILGDGSRLCKKTAADLLEAGVRVILVVFRADVQESADSAAYDTYYADTVDELNGIADMLAARYDTIDYYVHFAARSFEEEFPRLSGDAWQASKDTGINLLYHASRCFVRPAASKSGMRVLVVGSVAGLVPVRGSGMAGQMSTAAYMLVQSLAVDAAQDGIVVNALALGAADAEAGCLRADADLIAHIPMKRACRDDEIMKMVRFLLMDAPDYFTGNVLSLDGGLSSAYMRNW